MSISKALEKLGFDPINDFILQDDGDGAYIRDWNSASPQPSAEAVETARSEWQAEYDAQAYARNRKAEYPSIEECVHAILDDDLDALQAKRAEVKARYPKP